MDANEPTSLFRASFGAAVEVRARRPGVLCQVEVPAFLADGDAAAVYVRPAAEPGRLLMTDLGTTCMRLSYTRKLAPSNLATLDRLAEMHGFKLMDGSLVATMPASELAVGALGLVQIESEAEATIEAARARGDVARGFRDTVRDALARAFPRGCTLDYHDKHDRDGLYSVDAMITRGRKRSIGVAIAANDIEAERAVATSLFLDPKLKKPHIWAAIVRDVNALAGPTRLRLISNYFVAMPRYEDDPEALKPRLMQLAG